MDRGGSESQSACRRSAEAGDRLASGEGERRRRRRRRRRRSERESVTKELPRRESLNTAGLTIRSGTRQRWHGVSAAVPRVRRDSSSPGSEVTHLIALVHLDVIPQEDSRVHRESPAAHDRDTLATQRMAGESRRHETGLKIHSTPHARPTKRQRGGEERGTARLEGRFVLTRGCL